MGVVLMPSGAPFVSAVIVTVVFSSVVVTVTVSQFGNALVNCIGGPWLDNVMLCGAGFAPPTDAENTAPGGEGEPAGACAWPGAIVATLTSNTGSHYSWRFTTAYFTCVTVPVTRSDPVGAMFFPHATPPSTAPAAPG